MIGRRQLPVASPISPIALARSAIDAGRRSEAAQARAHDTVMRVFRPRGVLLTDSGTSALVLAMRVAMQRGGTVGLPAYGCVDFGAAARGAGARVRLYDVDPHTLSPDLDSVERLLTRGVDAIVVAHFFGYPADVPSVRALAQRFGVPVIEDAAQGAGGTLGGTRLGGLSELGVLSFGRGKGLCAGGGGALLAFDDRAVASLDALRLERSGAGWRGLGVTGVQWVLGRPTLYALPSTLPWLHLGEMVYRAPTEPMSMSIASASLVPTAFVLELNDLSVRRNHARMLERLATAADGLASPRPVAGGEPGYLRFPVRDTSGRRCAVANLGIGRPYPLPWVEVADLVSLLQTGEAEKIPGAMELAKSLFTLPTHRFVNRSDVAKIEHWMAS